MAPGPLIHAIVFSLYTIHIKDPQGSVPITDREVPTSTAEALVLTSTLNSDIIGNGEHAVIHCRAGVGRAGMIASAGH
jgi:protein-tyrosine phosphatase